MNIGFTTQTFIECIHLKQINELKLLDFAKDNGFNWIEIRDKSFHITDEILKSFAEEKELRVHYAFDGYTLEADNYLEIFEKIAKRAAIFGEGTFSRVIISNKLKDIDREHIYCTDDFNMLKERIENVIEIANKYKVIFAFENVFESVRGYSQLFDSIPNMDITLDTANFLVQDSEKIEEINEFCEKYKERIKYIHIKSTVNNKLQNNLVLDGDFNWGSFINDSNKWYCIELPAESDIQICKNKVVNAIEMIIAYCND